MCVCCCECVCVCVCVCRTPEERREEDPLNNAVLLSASGCVCLWLVPWTALLAVAHCTCTYCWRGRERAGAQEREGGAARRSQTKQTLCVCVWLYWHTHTRSSCWALSLPALALSFPFLISLRRRSHRQADLSGWCKWSVNKIAVTPMILNSSQVGESVPMCRISARSSTCCCCEEECILNPLFCSRNSRDSKYMEDEFLFHELKGKSPPPASEGERRWPRHTQTLPSSNKLKSTQKSFITSQWGPGVIQGRKITCQ